MRPHIEIKMVEYDDKYVTTLEREGRPTAKHTFEYNPNSLESRVKALIESVNYVSELADQCLREVS